ncbi:MAG: hypothetical protein IT340_01180 [Chloroflexi bacterium]|nr:hypothetical protein [Chloroflexota bacterium]
MLAPPHPPLRTCRLPAGSAHSTRPGRPGAERHGRYQAADLTADGVYESDALPGLRLRPDWLWQQPLPPLAAALATLARA